MSDVEIQAMSAVATALAGLDGQAQGRVLRWAAERFGVALAATRQDDSGQGADTGGRDPIVETNGRKASKTSDPMPKNASVRKASATGKAKQTFAWDKALDLAGNGSQTFKMVATQKAPSNALEKCLVAVYWLTRLSDSSVPATIDQVYTCFKHMDWRVPANLANSLQKAGSKGWLDTQKREDLRVVVQGENYFEHEMPAKKDNGS